MLHQSLSDHVFETDVATATFTCKVCGFTLSHLDAENFGISMLDLFFDDQSTPLPFLREQIPSDSGMPVNYDVISDTMKQKYIPAFSKQMYDSTPFLTEVSEGAEKTVRNELGKQLFNNLDKLILKNDL